MRPVQPIFVHGWGFGPDFWTPVVNALGWSDACVLDLGFLNHTSSPAWAEQKLQAVQAQGRAVLGIGHSLGFMWLAQHMALPATDRLVGINAFTVFAARTDFSAGVPVRVLQRMIKGLSGTAEKVLADFWSHCGAQAVVGTQDVVNLRTGLDLLLAGDVRPVIARKAGQCSILAARQDPVVSIAMTEDSFATSAPVQWIEGGHLLPQGSVQDCVAFLHATRKRMEQGGE